VFVNVQAELLIVNYKATQEHKCNRETVILRKNRKTENNTKIKNVATLNNNNMNEALSSRSINRNSINNLLKNVTN
jgi:hypothetical protein